MIDKIFILVSLDIYECDIRQDNLLQHKNMRKALWNYKTIFATEAAVKFSFFFFTFFLFHSSNDVVKFQKCFLLTRYLCLPVIGNVSISKEHCENGQKEKENKTIVDGVKETKKEIFICENLLFWEWKYPKNVIKRIAFAPLAISRKRDIFAKNLNSTKNSYAHMAKNI